MDCTITSTKPRRRGFTLAELLIATGIGGMVFAAVAAVIFYSARSFAALTNYVDLDKYSRSALDQMVSEIRQADRLQSYSENQLVFNATNPTNSSTYTITYTYSPDAKTLSKTIGGRTTVLLQECQSMKFDVFQRNPQGGTYEYYPVDASRPDLVKLVQLTWTCSRDILGKKANTESVQSAKVVIRKQ